MLRILLGVGLFAALGCGLGKLDLPAASGCSADADCHTGLACHALATFADGGCSESASAKQCTATCTTDADCASLKDRSGQGGFKCFAGCPGSASTCGQVPH